MDDTEATPVEDRLRSALTAGIDRVEADSGPPMADTADLAQRRVRHDRRRRAGLVSAAATLLVAATIGGWAVGRGPDGNPGIERVTSRPTSTTAAPAAGTGPGGGASSPGVEVATGELPVVRPAGGGETAPPLSSSGPSSGAQIVSPYGIWTAGPGQPSAPLFSRTLDDGTQLDVRGNRYDPSMFDLPPFWDPPGWCHPSGDLYIGARLPEAVGQSGGTRYDAVPPGTVLVSTTVVGGPEGHPQWLVVAQVPDGATVVRATFAGGATDEMEPVDGLAVLTAPVAGGEAPPDPWTVTDPVDIAGLTVVAGADDGSEVARYEGPWTGEVDLNAPTVLEGCTAPTSLPAPGAEQPADPAAAEAAARDVWDRAFGDPGSISVEDQLALIDDPRGVAEALTLVQQNYDEDQRAGISIPIVGLVFATPEQAFIEYTIDAGGLGTFPDRFAELVLVDGQWKVTQASVCSLTSLGGGTCAPLEDG